MTCKDRLEEYLRDNGAPFQVQHHARVFTAQEVAGAEHIPGKQLAKVVMAVADGKRHCQLPTGSTGRKPPRCLGSQRCGWLRSKSSPPRSRTARSARCRPFGNLYGVDVYVDQTFADDETIVMRAGTHADTLSLRAADFAHLVQPGVGQFGRHA
jgi:Ala-tRNA(Pro) deacylase